jgi:hypothetical protein
MSAKPSHETEALAARIFEALDDQRIALIEDLEGIAASKSSGSSTTTEHPLLDQVKERAFLSDRLCRYIQDGLRSGQLENVIGDLRSLKCDGLVREVCHSLIAYFLTYRFLDLSDLTNPNSAASAAPGRRLDQSWTLPEGYDTLWSDVPMAVDYAATKAMAMIPSRITAAPWLGALRPPEILRAILWMTEIGLTEFACDTDIPAAGSNGEVPVLRLRPSFSLQEANLWQQYETTLRTRRTAESARHNLVVDLGTGIRTVGGFNTYQLIADASANDVLKIATYHLRTIVGERSLVDWLAEKRTLRVRILCLGPTSSEALTEGADPDSLARSLRRGVHGFREIQRSLPKHVRKQVQTRVYGDTESGGLFRGAILCTGEESGGRPRRVIATVWPFGECRANYGEVLCLEGDSNVSRLLSEYFDTAWTNAVPIGSSGRFERTIWILASLRLEILSAAILCIIAVVALAAQPGVNSDAFFALVAAVPILAISLIRTIGRLYRASRLSRTIRMHR